LVNATAATGIAGPTDEATADGRFLYVLSGLTSTVDVYSIGDDGRLRWLQSATVPDGASQEGVAAS
jgi:6-phosphogluconolactonase (cycloisomerase 2 family)